MKYNKLKVGAQFSIYKIYISQDKQHGCIAYVRNTIVKDEIDLSIIGAIKARYPKAIVKHKIYTKRGGSSIHKRFIKSKVMIKIDIDLTRLSAINPSVLVKNDITTKPIKLKIYAKYKDWAISLSKPHFSHIDSFYSGNIIHFKKLCNKTIADFSDFFS